MYNQFGKKKVRNGIMGRTETYDQMGFRLTYPDIFDHTTGALMPMPVGNVNGLYLFLMNYMALTKEELAEISSHSAGGQMSEEDTLKATNAMGVMLTVAGIEGGQGPEEIIKRLSAEGSMTADDFIELGRCDDLTYYAIEDPKVEASFMNSMGPAFQEEFPVLKKELITALKNAEYYKPRVPGADLVGRKLSFETKDTEGNTVKSEELFAAHAVTMINLWATWCGPCRNELEELGNIHRRLADRDAAIVGICSDADEKADACRELMAKNNLTYINLLPFAQLEEQLPTEGYPTSFFVSREGVIMTYPVIGAPADLSLYEDTINEMLAKTGNVPAAQEGTTEHKKDVCRIIVKDEAGMPVKGVSVQFCSDTTCMMGKTDTEGTASFTAGNGHYTVHVHKAPVGYEACTEEFAVPEDLSDVVITLKKA